MNRSSLGPLVKAVETLKVFASSAPSPRELLANRSQRFDRLHAVLPRVATGRARVGQIWRVWDERSYPGGLTGFLAPELTREAIFAALRSRSVYATTQPTASSSTSA